MAKGISVNIGLNYVDKKHYQGWDGKLGGCVNDANDMYNIATSQGFQGTKLVDNLATRQTIIQSITQASTELAKGDLLLVSYSGHGGQRQDYSRDEDDGMDETWCLFDGELIDDELLTLWQRFAAGVRIFVISDSCHSGSVTKGPLTEAKKYTDLPPKAMPIEVAEKTAVAYRDFRSSNSPTTNAGKIEASVRLLSGCQDNQLSYDNGYNGVFTTQLKRVWGNGSFGGNYSQFHKQILSQMEAHQSPNHSVIGVLDTAYDTQRPFQI